MWACPNASIGDVTKLGGVINIVSHQHSEPSTIDEVINHQHGGWSEWSE
jgi:hypothetical protein